LARALVRALVRFDDCDRVVRLGFDPEPFATAPVASFGSPAALRSFIAISAISSGA
jgi:hypothetical protein